MRARTAPHLPIARGLPLRVALLGLLLPVLVAAFLAAGGTAAAQSSGATINVFCLEFGKTFPEGQTIKAQGLADAKIRTALAYALGKGYIASNPYEVQLAVWNLQDGQPFHDQQNRGTTIAQEIVGQANGPAPSADTTALANLTLTGVHQTSPTSAYGTATVQGNVDTSGLPVGFLLPASASNFQNLVGVVANGASRQAAATSSTSTTATSVAAATTTSGGSSTSTSSTAAVSALPASGGGGMSADGGPWGPALLGLLALAGVAGVLVRRHT